MGTFRYDIHSLNHVQTFDLALDLKKMGASTGRVSVRVMENWPGLDLFVQVKVVR